MTGLVMLIEYRKRVIILKVSSNLTIITTILLCYTLSESCFLSYNILQELSSS